MLNLLLLEPFGDEFNLGCCFYPRKGAFIRAEFDRVQGSLEAQLAIEESLCLLLALDLITSQGASAEGRGGRVFNLGCVTLVHIVQGQRVGVPLETLKVGVKLRHQE